MQSILYSPVSSDPLVEPLRTFSFYICYVESLRFGGLSCLGVFAYLFDCHYTFYIIPSCRYSSRVYRVGFHSPLVLSSMSFAFTLIAILWLSLRLFFQGFFEFFLVPLYLYYVMVPACFDSFYVFFVLWRASRLNTAFWPLNSPHKNLTSPLSAPPLSLFL